jgi:hypothetical protein
MESRTVTTTEYRGHNIAINPSGNADEALTDAFMIFEPSANPMFTRTLYEHPRDQIRTYSTEDEAKAAAMQLARVWLDQHLAPPADKSDR